MKLPGWDRLKRGARWPTLAGALVFAFAHAQAQNGPGTPPQDARTRAPIDLTGYWVSLVTEDWRFRMIVADRGDTESVPLNAHGLQVARSWNPAKDRADPEVACRAFGAAGLMRIPGRVHISWDDGSTLRVQTDAGTQTREFHFTGDVPAELTPSWQGYSKANWEGIPAAVRGGGRTSVPKEGYLKVITTGLRPGYLRTNGVPYSAHTQLLEYYDSFTETNGDVYLVVTTVVQDPDYLTEPFVTSTHYRRIADGQGWDPTPCRADVPR